MAEDPFPRDRVGATLRRLPAYLKLAWRLARDPLLSRARRAGVIAAAGYLASPIDLVPGIIPVIGQLDDIAVALGALKFALAGLDSERRREHLAAVGLEDGHLAEDLRTVGATSAWLLRAGARTTGRVAKHGGRAAVTGAKVAGSAAQKAGPAAKAAAAKAGPAARGAASRAGPAARSAAAKAGPAAKSAASWSAAAVRGATSKRPSMRIRVSIHRPAALRAGRRPEHAEERLTLEPDVIALPGPGEERGG
ncbi:MAG TPA: YkvA family protein [Candidatus Limnocylindrales bacterium]|nr:YkvA family protein [Candidatus Limnocylindrales bacterium]